MRAGVFRRDSRTWEKCDPKYILQQVWRVLRCDRREHLVKSDLEPQDLAVVRDSDTLAKAVVSQFPVEFAPPEQAVVDRFHMHRHDARPRRIAAYLDYVQGGHGDRPASIELRGAGVEDSDLGAMKGENGFDLRTVNSVSSYVEGWRVVGVQDETGNRGHFSADLAAAVLTGGT